MYDSRCIAFNRRYLSNGPLPACIGSPSIQFQSSRHDVKLRQLGCRRRISVVWCIKSTALHLHNPMQLVKLRQCMRTDTREA
jgi:hypothetical protein